ncbi:MULTISPECIES: nucleoside/nucleotide kinase family protein [Microbacterium]|uniref:nucleoside/nucleotide kinase family protein n=1 Tax=Microbacterium TaxID=33882 RepID=UPI000B24999A|nr:MULTISPECIES: nucleoside/nucleotide kinase family protein [unclassified Microbacterium]
MTPPPAAPPSLTVSHDVVELIDRARALASTGARRVLGITGTPGAGKSTVCAQLQDALGAQAVIVGMDGFHLANAELRRLGRRDRKGAPDTFDVDGYIALLARLRDQSGTPIYAPVFDRDLEESIGSALCVPADVPLIITEGNYLLHDGHGWERVAPLLDEAWFLEVEPSIRRRRLVARRESHGHPHDEAVDWVGSVDEPNAQLVESARDRADLIIRVADTASADATPTEGDIR